MTGTFFTTRFTPALLTSMTGMRVFRVGLVDVFLRSLYLCSLYALLVLNDRNARVSLRTSRYNICLRFTCAQYTLYLCLLYALLVLH